MAEPEPSTPCDAFQCHGQSLQQRGKAYLTKLRWTPSDRCTPAHARQMNTPYGTDAQVGFFAGQSKQTCNCNMDARVTVTLYFVSGVAVPLHVCANGGVTPSDARCTASCTTHCDRGTGVRAFMKADRVQTKQTKQHITIAKRR